MAGATVSQRMEMEFFIQLSEAHKLLESVRDERVRKFEARRLAEHIPEPRLRFGLQSLNHLRYFGMHRHSSDFTAFRGECI